MMFHSISLQNAMGNHHVLHVFPLKCPETTMVPMFLGDFSATDRLDDGGAP